MSLCQSLNYEYYKRVVKGLYEKYDFGMIKTSHELQDKIDQAYDKIMMEPFR